MQISSQIMSMASKALRGYSKKVLNAHSHVLINLVDEKVLPILVKNELYAQVYAPGCFYITDVQACIPIGGIIQRDETLKSLIRENCGKYIAKEYNVYEFSESDFIDMLNHMTGKPTHEEVLKKHPQAKYLAQWPGNSDGSEIGRWISYAVKPRIGVRGYVVDNASAVVMHTIGEIILPTKDTLEKVQPTKNVGNGKTISTGDICSVRVSNAWEDAKFLGIHVDGDLYSASVELKGEIKHVYISHIRVKKTEEDQKVETMVKHLDGVKDAKQIAEKLVALGYKLS